MKRHERCFFKQKTAYAIRTRDWSSDVCSSDLHDEIDLAYLQQLAQCDDALVHQLLTEMAVNTEEDLVQLMQLFVSDDFQGLAALAHKIKGAVALVQAKGLMRCCEQLEAACALADPALILPCVDALHAEMERFARALEEHMQHQGAQ